MKKIPVHQPPPDLPPAESLPATPPGYLPDALQTLLLGGIWWFVLIWLPLLQAETAASSLAASAPLLFKVEGLVSTVVSLVLIGLRVSGSAGNWRRFGKELTLLAAIAVCGVAMLVWVARASAPALDNLVYVAGLQGILALGCFLARRPLTSLHSN